MALAPFECPLTSVVWLDTNPPSAATNVPVRNNDQTSHIGPLTRTDVTLR